ncbi:UNVERIFIED_ORG: xanthine dehydrogenase family protein molybdopterin-binding subunit [Shinella sp. XGS7]|nr:xanthine dehydrogenase family protein molybdopterin-binding subunit [Shinella sp. XGS7]
MNTLQDTNPSALDGVALNRREWLSLLSAGGLVLGLSATGELHAAEAAKFGGDAMPGGLVDNPLVFVSVDPDGTVRIVCHRSEMGQGVRTSVPMVVADEMEAEWSRVRVIQAQGDHARYGNQNTDGSRSLRHAFDPLRRVGAAMRALLIQAAAQQWSLPADSLVARRHEVLHPASGRRLGYGELAAAAARLPLPARDSLVFKRPQDYRYIGTGKVRLIDSPDIVRGKATYGIDVRLPGLLHAVIARPPVLGGQLKSLQAEAARGMPGVLKVVELKSSALPPLFNPLGGVAVVASNTWLALRARDALQIEWAHGEHAGYDSQAYRQTLEAAVRQPGKVLRSQGDADAALASASKTVVADYYLPHLAHATMEPPVATARLVDGRCEVWAPVQDPQTTRDTVAAALGLKPEQVTVNVTLLGGGFGRKSKPDFVVEAALLSREMEGRPVQVTWTRQDDLQHDYLHTVSAQRLEAALDAQGRPTAWRHRVAAPTIISTFAAGAKLPAPFEIGMGAVNVPFPIPNLSVEAAEVSAHARIGWFRSVSNIPHAFAVQSFVAELAHAAGRDHRDYLLELIGPARRLNPAAELKDSWNYGESPERYPLDTGRMRQVLELASRQAGWGRTLPKGEGLGLAVAYSFMTYVAAAIRVRVSPSGAVQVLQVDMAVDCGPQINPERIRSQFEGGVIMGMGLALSGEISFKDGRVLQSNFHDYLVPRINEAPKSIRVHLVPAADYNQPLGGVGEPPVPPIAPALCNAIFAATGRRIRQLPVGDQLKAG